MMLKTISPGCGVRASLMLFFNEVFGNMLKLLDITYQRNLFECMYQYDTLQYFFLKTSEVLCNIAGTLMAFIVIYPPSITGIVG